MRGTRSRAAVKSVALLYLLLASLVQFAPSIHALSPHEDETASCKHGAAGAHFESAKHKDESPCPVCAHLIGRQVLSVSIAFRLDDSIVVRPAIQQPKTRATRDVFELPESRGPPSLT